MQVPKAAVWIVHAYQLSEIIQYHIWIIFCYMEDVNSNSCGCCGAYYALKRWRHTRKRSVLTIWQYSSQYKKNFHFNNIFPIRIKQCSVLKMSSSDSLQVTPFPIINSFVLCALPQRSPEKLMNVIRITLLHWSPFFFSRLSTLMPACPPACLPVCQPLTIHAGIESRMGKDGCQAWAWECGSDWR